MLCATETGIHAYSPWHKSEAFKTAYTGLHNVYADHSKKKRSYTGCVTNDCAQRDTVVKNDFSHISKLPAHNIITLAALRPG